MKTLFVETHFHLGDSRYDPDRDAVVARAEEKGVSPLITIGTDLESSRRAI